MPDEYDEAIRHQLLVEGYKEEETTSYLVVAPLLLSAFLARFDTIDVERMNEIPLPKLRRLLARLEKDHMRIARKANKTFNKNLHGFAGYEVDFEQKSLRKQGVTPNALTGKVAFKEAQDSPMSEGSLLDEFVILWVAAHSRRIAQLAQRSWAEGATVASVVRQVRGTSKRRYRDGLLGTLVSRDIPGMVYTAVQHVSTIARMAAMKRTPGVSRYRWVSILDNRTSDICRGLSGRVFEFGKGPRPPAHFRCRSHIVAVRDNDKSGAPAPQTYYQWLKGQSAGFQDEVLGPSRGKLFRDGGLSSDKFASLSLNKNFRPRTLEQMRALEPEVFNRAGVKPKPEQ